MGDGYCGRCKLSSVSRGPSSDCVRIPVRFGHTAQLPSGGSWMDLLKPGNIVPLPAPVNKPVPGTAGLYSTRGRPCGLLRESLFGLIVRFKVQPERQLSVNTRSIVLGRLDDQHPDPQILTEPPKPIREAQVPSGSKNKS
jgi:hypothetical protein